MLIFRTNGTERPVNITATFITGKTILAKLRYIWRYQSKAVFCSDRRERFIKICAPEILAPWFTCTINGCGLSITNFCNPFAMRRNVFSASGFFRSNIDGQGIDQSMHSAAVCTVSALLTELLSLTDLRV